MSYLELAKQVIAGLSERGELAELLERDTASDLSHVRGPIEDGPVLDVRRDLVAVRLHSRRLDRDLWLCCEESAAEELAAEFPGVPVLTFTEAARLRGKSTETLRAILDVKAEFGDAVLEQ